MFRRMQLERRYLRTDKTISLLRRALSAGNDRAARLYASRLASEGVTTLVP